MATRRYRDVFLPIVAGWLLAGPAIADGGGKPIDAVTAGGDKVMLYPNGRWEYVDPGKAAQAKTIADAYPENQARPAEP